MNKCTRGRNHYIDRACCRMRVRPFHVHNRFVFRNFELGEMRMNEGRFTALRVNMEQRRVHAAQH